jgi:hypothetical protein
MFVSPLIVGLPLVVMVVVGLVLLARGLRGEVTLAEPRCAKCGYDLRGFAGTPPTACAECGTDLRGGGAVLWGKRRRKPRLAWAGLALAGLPLLLIGGAMAVSAATGTRPGQVPRTNRAVLASLKTTAGTPWDWQEVEQRYASGAMNDDDGRQAIEHLIAHLAASPNPGQGPLQWCERVVEALDGAGAIPAEQYTRLAHAFYGMTPAVRVSPSVRRGAALHFAVDYAGSWNLPGVTMVKALRAVKLADGKTLPVSHEYDQASPGAAAPDPDLLSSHGPFGMDGKAVVDLPPGEHTMTFVVDAAALKQGTQPQLAQGRPGQARHWPRGRAKWTMDVPVKVTVVPADQSPVALVNDPALDPQKGGGMKVRRATVIRTATGPRMVIELDIGRLPVPISVDVVAKVAGQELPLGRYVSTADGRSWVGELAHTFESLAPDVRTLDLTLRPNPAHAEEVPGFDRVWGGVVELKAVPLQRHDLPAGDEPQPGQ